MSIQEILTYLLIAAHSLNNFTLPLHPARHCLRPPATRLKASSAGEEILDTLITREPPKHFTKKQKLMWRAAYGASLYFARQGVVQHLDEIFGQCFQTAMEIDARRSESSNKKPLEEVPDWALTKRIITYVVRFLRKEDRISRLSLAAARNKIAEADNWTEPEQARYDDRDFYETIFTRRPELLGLLGVEKVDDLAPEEINAKLETVAILSRLKGKHRDVVYLLYLENRSRDEAAFILNCSHQRIEQLNSEAAKTSRRIDFSRIEYMPERFLSIEEVRREVYEKYGDRLKILGSYEDNIRAESMEMQPSTPEEDIRLFEEAVESFPEGTETEKKIARMLFIEGKNEKEIQNRLNLTIHQYRMKSFSASVYLGYYLQARGVLGFIVRKSKFIPRQHLGFLEFVRLCYKHNAAIVYSKSCVVYDELRGEDIDLARLNNFDNYRNKPDGYAHLARDLRLAKEKGILRPGLSYSYYVGIGESPEARKVYKLIKQYRLPNKFIGKIMSVNFGENTYFKILRDLKDNPGSYRGVAGLKKLAKKYKIRPETIWFCFDRNFREEMGWGRLRHGRLPDGSEKVPDPGRILKAIAAAA